MKRIRWSPAAADLERIHDYLHEHNPSFVHSTVRLIYDAARSLRNMPERGRSGRKPGTRELLLVPLPYIVV